MKRLYDSLLQCQKEEEVKAEFCKFFKMKIFALRGIDHYTEHVLFEFKYDRNFRNPENVARALAAHDALRAKLLPQIYSLGFLNPDVDYFK